MTQTSRTSLEIATELNRLEPPAATRRCRPRFPGFPGIVRRNRYLERARSENPVADNGTAAGRKLNRRVKIIVSGEVIGAKLKS
jgi:hypothetical protein